MRLLLILLTATLLLAASARAATPGATPEASATPVPTRDVMVKAGLAMLDTAKLMDEGAAAIDGAAHGNPDLTALAASWRSDAATMRATGTWMIVTVTSTGMVHDPDKAHELDLQSLRANGEVMIAEGTAMTSHADEMGADVDQLAASHTLAADLIGRLHTAVDALRTAGEQTRKDGTEMRDYADGLLRSLGE